MNTEHDVGIQVNTDITNVTEDRWALGTKLIEAHSAVIIPLRPKDKIPIIKGWQNRTQSTLDELIEWQRNNANCNLGLVLGGNSGLVAIDVDGAEGEQILQDLCQGDLPPTVTYTTPGGGKRLLYRIRN